MSATACTHHYVIATPTPGAVMLPSVCKLCGTEREFPAFHDDDYLGSKQWSIVASRRKRTKGLAATISRDYHGSVI